MVNFSELVDPAQLEEPLAIIIVFILAMFFYSAVKLRSLVLSFTWMLLIVVLIMTFITNISFLWFWIMTILNSITLVMSIGIFFMFDSKI